MGGKVGVKLDLGAEGRLWVGGTSALSWPAAAAAAAIGAAARAGTASKSGATCHKSEQEYHRLL
jgi:hypothetical protein